MFFKKKNSISSISVETPSGVLIASVSADPSHPGIIVELENKNGERDNISLTECCADPEAIDKDKFATYIWGDTKIEDYTVYVRHKNIGK